MVDRARTPPTRTNLPRSESPSPGPTGRTRTSTTTSSSISPQNPTSEGASAPKGAHLHYTPGWEERQDGATRWNLQEVEWPLTPQNPTLNVPQDPNDDDSLVPDLDYLSNATNETEDFLSSDVDDDSDDEDANQPTTTRSGRKTGRKKRLIEECNLAYKPTSFPGRNFPCTLLARSQQKIRAADLEQEYVHGKLDWDEAVNSARTETRGAYWAEMEQNTDQNYGTVEDWNPAIFAVKANTDDNPNWGQTMNGSLAEGYWQACIKQYETLVKMDVWDEVEREGRMNILLATWAFQCKRFPDGLVRKLKARFCAMANHQVENVDYFETFAPVVTWNTVWILLTMSQLLHLATKQVDYTAAFVHAPIDKPPGYDEMTDLEKEQSGVYIELPRVFAEEKSGKVLKLNKSLYGLKQSPRKLVLFLKGNLEAVCLRVLLALLYSE
jgi:hypothetical protein